MMKNANYRSLTLKFYNDKYCQILLFLPKTKNKKLSNRVNESAFVAWQGISYAKLANLPPIIGLCKDLITTNP